MCGFCGFTGNLDNREEVINAMMDRIIHRGPDSGGVHTDEEVTFGFRRLSIIGLEDGYSLFIMRTKLLLLYLMVKFIIISH